jgi:hypothetical protein
VFALAVTTSAEAMTAAPISSAGQRDHANSLRVRPG